MNTFDSCPTFQGKLLGLRPLLPSDFEALFAVSSDPLIWEMHPEKNRYKRDVFENFFRVALESNGALLAYDAQTKEVLGSSRYSNLNWENKSIEIGYTFLSRKCWGKGHNREMKELMLNHALKSLDRVYFYIGEQNLRSRRAIEKLGAELLDKLKRETKDGSTYFNLKYEIEKLKWPKKSLNLFRP